MADLPAIKIWKMDYSFLIKNYLDQKLWQKTWTLFEYKTFKVTLNMYSIYTKEEKITFDIRVHYTDRYDRQTYCEQSICFSLKIDDITFLKRQINSAIFNCMVNVERQFIERTDYYNELLDRKWDEEERLKRIAEDFLDEHGVSNPNVREAYVDAYVDEYSEMPDLIGNYKDSLCYRTLTDLYLTWLSTLEDDPKKDIRTQEIKKVLSDDEYQQAVEEIKNYIVMMDDTENWNEDMKGKLEDV